MAGIVMAGGASSMVEHEQVRQTIAELWVDLLLAEDVSGDADFFKLGGDSLTAVTLVAHIEAKLGVTLDPALVFENPQLDDFSMIISEILREERREGAL